MKQVVYEKFGPPSTVAKCVDAPDPQAPSAWEVLVAVDAFPINPADLAMMYGQYGILNKPPSTIGMEAVGTVVEKGKSVANLSIGDRVILLANNNWATLRKVPATLAVKVPHDLNVLQLAMLKVSGLTAYQILSQIELLKSGQYVIQNAPLSAVGRYVIQIAKELNLRTINLVRRPEQMEQVTKLGGDLVLLDEGSVIDAVKQKIGSGAVRIGIDAVAGPSTNRLAECLQDGCTIVNYGMLSMQPCQIDASHTIFRGIRLIGFWLSKVLNKLSAQDREQQILRLVGMMAEGKIYGEIDSVYSIENISKAIRRAEQPARAGKVLVSMNSADHSLPIGGN